MIAALDKARCDQAGSRRASCLSLYLCLFLLGLFSLQNAVSAPDFPKLSGRVVDSANMLDTAAEQRISQLLEGHEQATSNQVVVLTLPDLGGEVIEQYGYQLGRHWGIGQQGKDNGVLLIVAQEERKVRIEVGYGLEGTLTDAISANIIHSIILPRFRQGQFQTGIEQGVNGIIQALGGQYTMKSRKKSGNDSSNLIFIIFLIAWVLLNIFGRGGIYIGGHGRRGGGGFGGGGFSGGGGGFGGGGASGGW